ncbi:MAG: alpha/beta hydrolase [Candidatus Eremiobacteraeota bacterium]|nr:alpha/beta hydrolase [Candidatus Eremiobacteraeota bacterium]
MRRLPILLAFAAGFAVCTGIAGSAVGSEGQLEPYIHPQRLVDVGGHKLNLYCTGHGSPSVILDAGGGQTMLTWSKVQPAIAKFTRVCSFDRASMGFSGDGPLPRDANAIVTDLHTLLQRANIAPPYVLVGHSDGGLYAFALRRPLSAGRGRHGARRSLVSKADGGIACRVAFGEAYGSSRGQ